MIEQPSQPLSPQPPFYVSRRRFEELVSEAMAEIPDQLWNYIQNVVITVEEWPNRRQIESVGIAPGSTLLGLYEGVPLTVRTSHYGLVPPDKITIFRGPIMRICPPAEDAIRSQVRQTVLHEIAHHFGISDARLIELGAY
jgi:predicted Zn-dependent protease with MMP-like domain